jgi:acetylornithine deacetylase/succinyl-diaminopimelate desuccinylase-like protein
MGQLGLEEVRARVDEHWDAVVEILKKKIALGAVSAKGIPADHMRASAEFVASQFIAVGIDAHVVQSTNPDGTLGAWEVIGSRIVSSDAPTVLLYAHHDVQPADDDPQRPQWKTASFVGTVIHVGDGDVAGEDRLFGRGAADDGGGIAIHLGSLAALGDDLGVNIKIFIEGEEEMGSGSFIPFLTAHKDDFAADVIIVADSGNWAPDVPSLTTSLRGNTDIDVTVRGLEHPVHSGQFGGPVLDSLTLSAMLIASMYSSDGSGELVIPGLLSEEPIGGLQQDLDADDFVRDSSAQGTLAGTGSLASRLWTKPSISVIGVDAQAVDGSFNVLSASTRFRLSVRTAPHQAPAEAYRAIADFLVAHAPFGASVEVSCGSTGRGWAMDADSEVTKIMLSAMEEAFDAAPVNKGEGGSIPFIPELQELFPAAQVLVTGPEDPMSNAHSPNESVSLPGLRKDTVAQALFLSRLSRLD